MARAKFVWTPALTRAVSLDGAHYLNLNDATLNLGASDFCLSALLKVASTMSDAEGWIAAKGAVNLASAAGWHWFVDKTNRRLGLRINDGDASPVVVYSPNSSFSLDAWFLANVLAVRGGSALFYVDGVPVGGGSILAAAGSLDNNELFKVGAYASDTYRLKGAIDFLRLRIGTIAQPWYTQEWDRVRYGYPRGPGDWLESWDFEDTLVGGSSSLRTLVWQASGSAVYENGYPYAAAPLTVILPENFSFDYEAAPRESYDIARALDGSLNVYADDSSHRETLRLPFEYVSFSTMMAIRAAYESCNPIDFYQDADQPRTFQGFIVSPPAFRERFLGLWDGEIVMEQI